MQRLRIRSDHIRLTSIVYSKHLFVSYLSNSYCFSLALSTLLPPPEKIRAVYPFVSYFFCSFNLINVISIYTGKDLVTSACNSNAIQILVSFFFVVINKRNFSQSLEMSFHMREESCIQDSSVSFTQSI